MPAKVKKKQAKKGHAATGGKASSSKAKPAEKAGPKAAKNGKSGKNVSAPRAKALPAKAAQAALKAKLNAKKPVDLAPLKAKVTEAKKELTRAENEGSALRAQARTTEAVAKQAYIKALAPYRDACRKAGVECEFAGGRAANKTPAVRFIVEKVKNGVKVVLKGKPETEQVIPFAALKKSIGKAAVAYVEKFIGDKTAVGNKQGSLGNRIRAVLAKK